MKCKTCNMNVESGQVYSCGRLGECNFSEPIIKIPKCEHYKDWEYEKNYHAFLSELKRLNPNTHFIPVY